MSAAKCELQEFPCVNVDYSPFDRTCAQELRLPVDADLIVNHSDFCVLVPISDALRSPDLETSDYLRGLSGKMGLYHLWVDYDQCDDHHRHTMLGVYVGKGLANQRTRSHIKDKFPRADVLFVSFYECQNRIAKYLEQLFLDTYKFELNKNENRGERVLYGVWDDQRHSIGTEMHSVANALAKRIGPGPYEV